MTRLFFILTDNITPYTRTSTALLFSSESDKPLLMENHGFLSVKCNNLNLNKNFMYSYVSDVDFRLSRCLYVKDSRYVSSVSPVSEFMRDRVDSVVKANPHYFSLDKMTDKEYFPFSGYSFFKPKSIREIKTEIEESPLNCTPEDFGI